MSDTIQVQEKDFKELCNIIRRYVNFKKVLYYIDKGISEEFCSKQEAFFQKKKENPEFINISGGCCGESILNNTIFIEPDRMNNIEKNLYELYEKFYYPVYIEELIDFIQQKYEKIASKMGKEGQSVPEDEEKDFLHNIYKEGVNYFLYSKLVKKLKEYEESISSQPMLLAHPRNIEEEDMLDFISSSYVSKLLSSDMVVIEKPIYYDIKEFELYDELRYLYLEGRFTTIEQDKMNTFVMKYNKAFFKDTKFENIHNLSTYICYLPFELNSKNPNLSLQTNDYMQITYFKKNTSYAKFTMDSHIDSKYDTGKKISLLFFLFPKELMLGERALKVKVRTMKKGDYIGKEKDFEEKEITITNPLSMIAYKSRRVMLEFEKTSIDFMILSYYIHGPTDKESHF